MASVRYHPLGDTIGAPGRFPEREPAAAPFPNFTKDNQTNMSPAQGDAIRRFSTKDNLTRMEAALELGVSVKTLAKWAVEKKGPPFRKSSNGTAYYERQTLFDWRSRQSITLRYAFVPDSVAA